MESETFGNACEFAWQEDGAEHWCCLEKGHSEPHKCGACGEEK